jgi:hypothetical protein
MTKPLASLFIAALVVATPAASAAFVSNDYGSYSVLYDDSTALGAPSFNSGGAGNSVSFGWSFPSASVSSNSGLATGSLPLPEFTITPNAGYVLSGPVSSFFGSLNYVETAGSTTSVTLSGLVSINGGPAFASSSLITKTPIDAFSGLYTGDGVGLIGTFSSFHFSGGLLSASADVTVPGGFAQVSSQPSQSIASISFNAAPVPEPESYLLMLAGVALLGALVRRRSATAA